nr:SPOR domain-containing protein [Desulfovibrio cuneatus]
MVAHNSGGQGYGTQEYPGQRSGGRPVPTPVGSPVYGAAHTPGYGTSAGTTVQNQGQAGSSAAYRTAATQGKGQYFAQIGAFSVQGNAERLCEKIRQTGVPARSLYDSQKGLWRVQVGPYRSVNEANQAAATVRKSPTLLSSMDR